MDESALTDLDRRVLAAITAAFPVSQSPYCDLGDVLGAPEIDVLESAMKLREVGAVATVAAVFSAAADVQTLADEDVALATLVSFDLPWGEHPYAEVAAQLSLQGIDRDEAWVVAKLRAWMDDGAIVRVAARG